MLFSIIIPVYNVEAYLEECVNSVLYQTYEKFELILVDDGSTDRSGELCDAFARQDSRIQAVTGNRMAHDGYKMRYFNDIIWIYEYQADG